MSVTISGIEENGIFSDAWKQNGISGGCRLESCNGNEINDVLDYRYYCDSRILNLHFARPDGEKVSIRIKNTHSVDALGLLFDTYLMDKQQRCRNKCIFCFIDQLPEGMRESLYFKDDDSRLSFFFGNYVTLTNMTEHDVQRIIDLHISPVNVSVHTMNPDLRVRMMGNRNAGKALEILGRFAENNIRINAQLVLCPGINDGDELKFSLDELAKLYPSVQSVAAVPVGLTDHRDGLCSLEMYTKKTAADVIEIIEHFNYDFRMKNGSNFAYAADEFYLKAGQPMPAYDYYGEFDQLDNGVGMWTLLKSDFFDALDEICVSPVKRKVALITGVAAAPLMRECAQAVSGKFPGVTVDVFPVVNDFFGHNITVAGLVTAGDIISQIKDLSEYDEALIPSVMLKGSEERIFLDDISVEELSEKLNVKITPQSPDGCELLNKILSTEKG